MQAHNLKDNEEILKELNNLEEKLHLIVDFYKDLEILREKRKNLIENLSDKRKTKSQLQITPIGITFEERYFNKDIRSNTSVLNFLKSKSLYKIHNQLEDLSSHHKKLEKKINDIQITISQPDTGLDKRAELDKVLVELQVEKNKVKDEIVKFVDECAVDGMEEITDLVSTLEDENNELQNKIILMERKVYFVNDAITALVIENHSLKKGDRVPSNIFKRSILDKILPLEIPQVIVEDKSNDGNESMMVDDGVKSRPLYYTEDVHSVDRRTLDSFALDAPLATWKTDEESTKQHVQRIGENLHSIVINQMRLNMVKEYVWEHGAKDITFENPHVPLSYQGGKY